MDDIIGFPSPGRRNDKWEKRGDFENSGINSLSEHHLQITARRSDRARKLTRSDRHEHLNDSFQRQVGERAPDKGMVFI